MERKERKQFINGKAYDWSSVTIQVNGCEEIEPTGIDYGDKIEKELINGRGGRVRGFGTGKKSNTVKITMLREDYNTFCEAYKGKMFGKIIVPVITVSYADEGADTSTDELKNVTFESRDFKASENDKSVSVDISGFAVGGILTDGMEM